MFVYSLKWWERQECHLVCQLWDFLHGRLFCSLALFVWRSGGGWLGYVYTPGNGPPQSNVSLYIYSWLDPSCLLSSFFLALLRLHLSFFLAPSCPSAPLQQHNFHLGVANAVTMVTMLLCRCSSLRCRPGNVSWCIDESQRRVHKVSHSLYIPGYSLIPRPPNTQDL